MIWVEEQPWFHNRISSSILRRSRSVLLSTGGIVAEAEIQFPLGDSVWIEVCCQGRDVSNIGVIH